MTKIMVVEDDQSLREIYSIRLTAEGFDVVSAGDGEEALAIAVKEKPDLIVSDVMMPKISGFDMLDILRSTPETKDVKVIMMTALSSDDQRKRGESLGADRYLVKSQVGIEDVINAVKEVLSGKPAGAVGEGAQVTAGTASPAQVNMPAPDLKNGPQFNPNIMEQPNPAVPTQLAVPQTPVEAQAPVATQTQPVVAPAVPQPVEQPVVVSVQPAPQAAPQVVEQPQPVPQAPEAQQPTQATAVPEVQVQAQMQAPAPQPVPPVSPTSQVQDGTNPAQ